MNHLTRALIVGACILMLLLAMAANADCKPKSNIKDLLAVIGSVPQPIVISKP